MQIKINDILKTSVLASTIKAELLIENLSLIINKELNIILDFKNIDGATFLFLNTILDYIKKELTLSTITFINVNENIKNQFEFIIKNYTDIKNLISNGKLAIN